MRTKRIQVKDLVEGMKIKTYDPLAREVVYKQVTHKWDTIIPTEKQRMITFQNGTTLKCSENHPIMVIEKSGDVVEIYPDDLTTDHLVISEEGFTHLKSISNDQNSPNYIDITVADTHTFFAAHSETAEMVLTHNSQGGVRGGSATIYTALWHLEIEDLMVLKNNKGTDENRVRNMDYAIQFNKVMYERLLTGGNITLFSPNDVPEMYDAFFVDVDKFRDLYEAAEKNPNIRKKTVSALDLFSAFLQERKDTGRIYLMNVDHANDHGSFDKHQAPIKQSNLCSEIDLPTKPLNSLHDPEGEISLCTLAAINWGKIRDPRDFERLCTLIVRALDELLSYQNYPVVAAERSTLSRRPLGIGIVNFAYWLARNDLTYQHITPEGLQKIHEYAEAWSYYLIKASIDLAAEKGACAWSNQTKYHYGQFPIDTYKRDVDELVNPVYNMDWHNLRFMAGKHGIRNSTLMALMPSETSAQISNSTNGIEPPRALVSIKTSKDGVLKQVVPEVRKLKNKYDLLWDQKSPEGYLKICAVLQKFIDQGISVNTSYNPEHYPLEEGETVHRIPMSEIMKHMIMFYKYGGKQLYYFNTYDGAGEVATEEPRNAEEIVEEDCESCKL
jgi:ribonucleoside-diphosphate reductase alpha chain